MNPHHTRQSHIEESIHIKLTSHFDHSQKQNRMDVQFIEEIHKKTNQGGHSTYEEVRPNVGLEVGYALFLRF